MRRLKRDLAGVKGFAERRGRAASTTTPTDDESEAYDRLLAFTQRRDKAVARSRQPRAPGTWRPCC